MLQNAQLRIQIVLENGKTQKYAFWAFVVGFVLVVAFAAATLGVLRGNWDIGQNASTLFSAEFADMLTGYPMWGLLVSVLWQTNKGKIARQRRTDLIIAAAGFIVPMTAFYVAYLYATYGRLGHSAYFANSMIAVCLLTTLVAGSVGFLLGQRKAAIKPNQSRKPAVKAAE